MAVTAIIRELKYQLECQKNGCMIAPCTIKTDEVSLFKWTLSFQIGAEGVVFETIDFLVIFPSDYPFRPPTVIAVNPDYKWVKFCLGKEWSPGARVSSIIFHIYASITDPEYYENTGRFSDVPPQPSPS